MLDTGNLEFELRRREPIEKVNERSLLEERLAGLVSKENRIKASYREGIDTLEEYKENKALIQQERDRLLAQISELSQADTDNEQDLTAAALKRVHNVYSILVSDKYTDTQKNEALKQIIDKIVYDRKNDSLKIYYFLSN